MNHYTHCQTKLWLLTALAWVLMPKTVQAQTIPNITITTPTVRVPNISITQPSFTNQSLNNPSVTPGFTNTTVPTVGTFDPLSTRRTRINIPRVTLPNNNISVSQPTVSTQSTIDITLPTVPNIDFGNPSITRPDITELETFSTGVTSQIKINGETVDNSQLNLTTSP
jgi:hypothetical protein